MRCSECSTENYEARRFCRECGLMLVSVCPRCGYGNMTADKFCGGCGMSRATPEMTAAAAPSPPEQLASPEGKYSRDDISELLHGGAKKTVPQVKKREAKDTEPVSQDLLDSIFSAEDDDSTQKKDTSS